jgi:glucose-6-phosphate-specific signal transduction histidine kinase
MKNQTNMFYYATPGKEPAEAGKAQAKHSIAGLSGSIMRLTKNAGNRILRAASITTKKTQTDLIQARLQLVEKKFGINCHFINELDQVLLTAKKEHLLLGIINLQLYYASHCEDISMLVVRLQQKEDKIHLSISAISAAPCESLAQARHGFNRMRNRVVNMGGRLDLTYDENNGSSLELFL